jgi:hypothetical protein
MTVTQLNLQARAVGDGRLERPETTADRIRRLQLEARALAHDEVERLCDDLIQLAQRAAEIAQGGDAYPAGVRDMAARLAADLPDRAQGMLSISERMALATHT